MLCVWGVFMWFLLWASDIVCSLSLIYSICYIFHAELFLSDLCFLMFRLYFLNTCSIMLGHLYLLYSAGLLIFLVLRSVTDISCTSLSHWYFLYSAQPLISPVLCWATNILVLWRATYISCTPFGHWYFLYFARLLIFLDLLSEFRRMFFNETLSTSILTLL